MFIFKIAKLSIIRFLFDNSFLYGLGIFLDLICNGEILVLLEFEFLILFAYFKLLISLVGLLNHVHYFPLLRLVQDLVHGGITKIPK